MHKRLSSGKILLILDLDETLLHASHQPLKNEPDFEIFGYFVYERPYLHEFLSYCSRNFNLAIWSSAADEYVQAIVKHIFSSAIELKFVWGRSRCTPRKYSTNDDFYVDVASHYEYTKQFKKIRRKGYDLKKVLIVDDTPSKVANSYGNAIYVREFNGEPEDNELQLLASYLETIKEAENLRLIEKRGWQAGSKIQ